MASGTLHQVTALPTGSPALRRLVTVLRERAWIIVLCIVLGGAGGGLYLWRAPKLYEATAVLHYQADKLRLLNLDTPAIEAGPQFMEQQLVALQRMLSSASLLRRVAEIRQLASLHRYGNGETGTRALENAVTVLQRRLTVTVPANDVVINVTVQDSSADLSAGLANAIVDELLAENSRSREELLREVSSRLEGMLEKVRQELRVEPPPTNVVSGGAATEDPVRLAGELQVFSKLAAAAEMRWLQADAAYSAATKQGTNLEALLQVPAVAATPGIAELNAAYRQKQNAFDTVARRYLAKHPTNVVARAELAGAADALAREVARAVAQLQTARESAKQDRDRTRRDFESRLEAATKMAPPPAVGATASGLQHQVEGVRQFHDRVMERLRQLNLTGDLLVSPLNVSVRATPPASPVGPDPVRLIGYGLLAGLVVGLLVSLLFGLGDTSLNNVDDTERILGLPVLSVVPRLKDTNTELAAAEGFRSLRTSIAVSSKGKEPRVVLFTSTSPDEGKTFCALNFAVGLAQQGHKTILIECDLRRPMAAPSLTLVKVDAPGVSDFLKSGAGLSPGTAGSPAVARGEGLSFAEIRRKKSERTDGGMERTGVAEPLASGGALGLEEVVQRTEVANLYFVAAGKPVANPTELLSRPRFEQLLNGLLQRYDRVVLDSAPVLGVSETLLLASRVQGVCFVVRGGHTPRNAVVRAVEILRRADVTVLGVVLNGISPKHSDPYGQDYYYHRTGDRNAKT